MTNDDGEPSVYSLRDRVGVWVNSPTARNTIIALITLNAITLGLETSTAMMARFGALLLAIDHIVLGVFVAEIGAKLFACGWRFFRQPWNVFDFLVVGVALVPSSGPLAVLRTLRILRVLRLISVLPRLRFVVEALLHALPGISGIALLMMVIFYVASVMATNFFGDVQPEWFGTLGRSMYTLFQIMTLESWSMGIVRPVMETYPYAWLFFIPFILIATFTILNLFIAIIVDTMQTMHDATHHHGEEVITQAVLQEGSQLEAELQAVRQELESIKALIVRAYPEEPSG
jgi:voltage-gated sodium channel